jgi:hypothetical protein
LDGEVCGDGQDNDDDGEVDCDDPDCLGAPTCGELDCGDGLDDDQDGLTDCDDLDCAASRLCAREGDCDDGADNDNDRAADCEDADCAQDQACRQGAGTCEDPLLLDASGLFTGSTEGLDDAHAPSCQPDTAQEAVWRLVAPTSGAVCLDTYGTVFDTVLSVRADCPDAASELVCNDDTEDPSYRLRSQVELAVEADASYFILVDGFRGNAGDYALRLRQGTCAERACADGQDDDDDGERDCADDDCAADPRCLPETLCEDLRDNDNDALTDCDDPDCLGDPACLPSELCDDARDNDDDALTDCDDPDCAAAPACLQSAAALPDPGQRVTQAGSLGADSPRWARPRVECRSRAPGAYPFEVWALTNRDDQPHRASVTASWEGGDGFLHLFRAPFDPRDLSSCVAGNDDLLDAAHSAVGPVWVAPGETLYAVASTLTAQGEVPSFTLTAQTWADPEALCQDQADDDANGSTDCDDLACAPLADLCAPTDLPAPARGQTRVVSGSLDEDDLRWARPSAVCTLRNGVHPLDLHFVVNEGQQAVILDARAVWGGGDGFLHALRAPFDLEALRGCEAGNDDGTSSEESFLEGVLLNPGERVALVASSYSAEDWIGPYELEISTQP